MIGVVAVTASGRAAADRLAAAWTGEVRIYDDGAAGESLRAAFGQCDQIIAFLAAGAVIRILAPLLESKHSDPAVVCVDEAQRFAVALLAGHHGANDLAQRVADELGCRPVITTASDAAGVTALDSFGAASGFTLANPEVLPTAGTALLSGEPFGVSGVERWPLPALPTTMSAEPTPAHVPGPGPGLGGENPAAVCLVVSDMTGDLDPRVLLYRPPSLTVGVGASRGASAVDILAAVDTALASGGLAVESVKRLASIDLKAAEPGLLDAAERRGWPIAFYTAAELAPIPVPNPSSVVEAEVGTASVAEAAACFDGPGRPLAELIVAKTKSPSTPGTAATATAAVARLRPRGRLAVVGLGPGARDLLAARAGTVLRESSVIVGLDQYVDQIRDLLRPGTVVEASGLGAEEERARRAVELARGGLAVALVGSGDAGVYAMASPALDLIGTDDVDVVCVPGITAATAASNILGAPLGHDHCSISLSDLHTPWPAIERRVRAAAEGDFVVSFYNPRSRQRDWQLVRALEILGEHRPAQTPVGWVRNASRADESHGLARLDEFDPGVVDMVTTVIVGCSQSRIVGGRFVTARGYTWAA